MLPHESTSSSSFFNTSSFLPSSSTSSSVEIIDSEPVIKVEDEIQFNSAGEIELESEVKVKVEEELDKEKEENVFQHLSQLLNEPDDDRTNKNGTVCDPQNVEMMFELKEEEDVGMDETVLSESDLFIQNLVTTTNIIIPSKSSSCVNKIPRSIQIQSNCDNRVPNKQKIFYKEYKCGYCDYKTNHEYHLKAHLRTHKSIKSSSSPTKKIRFPCHLCSVTTSRKSHLKTHIQNVHADKHLFKCTESGCGFSTNKRHTLKLHGFSRHGKREEDLKIFTCSFCPFKTPHNKNLQEHVNGVHTRLFKFACDLCPYKTCRKPNLQRHFAMVHLNLRPFKCPETGCDYAAKEVGAFKNHMKFHKKSVHEADDIWKSVSSNYYNSSAVQIQIQPESTSQIQIQPESTSQLDLKLSTKARPTSKIPICSENVQSNSKSKVKSCEIVILYQCNNCEFYTQEQKQLAAHLYNQHNLPKVQLQLLK